MQPNKEVKLKKRETNLESLKSEPVINPRREKQQQRKEKIMLKLTERYLHGYTMDDIEYKEIVDNLVTKLLKGKKTSEQDEEIGPLIKEEVGEYNEITAEIYRDTAKAYLKYRSRKITKENIENIVYSAL
jgi:hypothetical protein